jgi:hypothetical protein
MVYIFFVFWIFQAIKAGFLPQKNCEKSKEFYQFLFVNQNANKLFWQLLL